MSMRYYPVYAQGAIYFSEDYDSVKVILHIEKDFGELSPRTISLLENGTYDRAAAEEICRLLSVTFQSGATDYSFIADDFTDDLPCWINEGFGRIENSIVESAYFTDLEAEFRYASEDIEDERLDSCLMLILPSPFIWGIADYDGPKTKQEVVDLIHESVKPLLRDDIDWECRLGDLIGTTFG